MIINFFFLFDQILQWTFLYLWLACVNTVCGRSLCWVGVAWLRTTRIHPLLCSSFGCLMPRHTNYTMTCLSSCQAQVQVSYLSTFLITNNTVIYCYIFVNIANIFESNNSSFYILSPFTYVFMCVYSRRQCVFVAVFGWMSSWCWQCDLGLLNGLCGSKSEQFPTPGRPHTAGKSGTASELPWNTPSPTVDAQNWSANQHCWTYCCICCEGSDKILHLCILCVCFFPCLQVYFFPDVIF